MRKPGILAWGGGGGGGVGENYISEELISIKTDEQHEENKPALPKTVVTVPPFGQLDFSMK